MSAADARAIDKITAREIMRTNVLTVSRNTPLSEVERLLGEHRIALESRNHSLPTFIGAEDAKDAV